MIEIISAAYHIRLAVATSRATARARFLCYPLNPLAILSTSSAWKSEASVVACVSFKANFFVAIGRYGSVIE